MLKFIESILDNVMVQALALISIMDCDVNLFCDALVAEEDMTVIKAARALLAGPTRDWERRGYYAIRTGLAILDAEIRRREFDELLEEDFHIPLDDLGFN